MPPIAVVLEVAPKRTLATALIWPGWCRGGRDADAALATLLAYGPRYAAVVGRARQGFRPPSGVKAFEIVERLKGNATTEYGVPDMAFAADAEPFDNAALRRCTAILKACWKGFDRAVQAAEGVELTKGPRGGGRDLDKIVEHTWGAEAAYVGALGWKVEIKDRTPPAEALAQAHQGLLDGLAAALRGEIEPLGPRGGKRWNPYRAVRRAAWHVLDHLWEIEDRSKGGEGGI